MNSSSLDLRVSTNPDFRLPGAFLCLLIALLLISENLPQGEKFYWVASEFKVAAGDNPNWSHPALNDSHWRSVSMIDIGHNMGPVFWIRKEVEIPRLKSWQAPLSLRISGLFSAEIYWDGELLASKGKPGSERNIEQPGPLDASFFLPEHHATPGSHELALRVSANHIGFNANQLIHVVGIASYRAEQTRSVFYYAVPILLVGSLVILSIYFVRYGIVERNRRFGALAFISLCGLIQALAEISRSMLEIPYSLQILRGGLVFFFAFGIGIGLNLIACCYNNSKRSTRAYLSGIASAIIFILMTEGLDAKTIVALRVLTIVPACIGLKELLGLRINPASLIFPLFCCWWVASQYFSAMFLDSFVFSSLSAYLLFSWHMLEAETNMSQKAQSQIQEKPASEKATKIVADLRGTKTLVPLESIKFIRAAGNYTELVCDEGAVHLASCPLGKVSEIHTRFVRIHRSIAVNPEYVKSISSREGSRYYIELTDGTQLPISRYRVKEVRESMGFQTQ